MLRRAARRSSQRWLPWLGRPGHHGAPVALRRGRRPRTGGPAFYPFADFSPELAAMRWAARHGVAVTLLRPAAGRPGLGRAGRDRPGAATGPRRAFADALRAPPQRAADGDDLWDRLVEAAAPGLPAEAVRRAALLSAGRCARDAAPAAGWPPLDLAREAWMRPGIAEAAAGGAPGRRRWSAPSTPRR